MSLRGKKILVTCGPTWVPLDDVRVISNRSTGEMGHLLAKSLKAHKANVTLLEGPVTHVMNLKGIKIIKYWFFDELKQLLTREVRRGYDCVIHAAAVSDFKPSQKMDGKIKSDSKVTIRLSPLPKLINSIKTLKPKTYLVGFKLESSSKEEITAIEGTQKLFKQGRCDLVIANFIKPNMYEALIIDSNQTLLGKIKSKNDLVKLLVQILNDHL